MPSIRIDHKNGCGSVAVDGVMLNCVTQTAVHLAPNALPVVTVELVAWENEIDFGDAVLKIGGIAAPESFERAMLDYLKAKYPKDEEQPGMLVSLGGPLPVGVFVSESDGAEVSKPGLCIVATDGERLGRLGWTPGA